MRTEILGAEGIEKAAFLLQRGENVVFPTETVYGLGASIFCDEAIQRVFEIKKRPSDNPLIVHIASIDQLYLLSDEIPKELFLLSDLFWPGPLTFVIPAKKGLSLLISKGLSTVAVRMPSHPMALELIRKAKAPLVGPSANLSGFPSPTNALDVLEDLDGKVPLILDGGSSSIGIESTVIGLFGQKPILLRPGLITQEKMEAILKKPLDLPQGKEGRHSPGMRYRHYAPKAKVKLCYTKEEIQGGFVLSFSPKKGEYLLKTQTLYASFREADRQGISLIEVDCTFDLKENLALYNRLLKASGQ